MTIFNVFCFLPSSLALWYQIVRKYFLWVILRRPLIKIRSQYPSEDDVTIITLFFWLGRQADGLGGGGVQHDRRGPTTMHKYIHI